MDRNGTSMSVHAILTSMPWYQPYLLIHADNTISAPLGHVNKPPFVIARVFSDLLSLTGYGRKICLNKGQVCHFLTAAHILLHERLINQETLVISLATAQKLSWETGWARAVNMGSTSRHPLCTLNPIEFSGIISSYKCSVRALFDKYLPFYRDLQRT